VSFEAAAALFLPVGAGEESMLRAPKDWGFDFGRMPQEDPVVWGREPSYEPAGRSLLRSAARRERTLAELRARHSGGLIATNVQRWPLGFYRARRLPGLMAWLREGVLVELGSGAPGQRAIDAAAQAAGASEPVTRMRISEAGSATARIERANGPPGVLRAGAAGSAVDPAWTAAGMKRLAPLKLPWVPSPAGEGRNASISWSAESLLPGRTPRRLTPALMSDLSTFALELPRIDAVPTAFADDLGSLVECLPAHEGPLRRLLDEHQPALSTLPSVMRHGDLWTGNLLVNRGRLSGVVDWDTWHPSGVPGTDLLHVVGTARAVATYKTFAEQLEDRPWDSPAFRDGSADYWTELGIQPSEQTLQAVGVACWATQALHDLTTGPHQREDPLWLERNIRPVLDLQ
jgi:hypothetical protein